jgi:GntR family transcriptional regulator
MEERGIVLRRHGAGTFVRSGSVLSYLNENFSVVESIRAANMIYSVKDVRVEMRPANNELAQSLQLKIDDPVLEVERTRVVDGMPAAYTLDCFPGAIVSDISAVKSEASKESLYSLLRDRFQLVISFGVAHVTCLEATPIIAEKLNVKIGSPVLNLKQIDFTAEEKPVVYTMDYYLSGVFDFVIFRKGGGIRQ